MIDSDLYKTLNDIELLKHKINNTLLMCNVIRDDLETVMELEKMRREEGYYDDPRCTTKVDTTGTYGCDKTGTTAQWDTTTTRGTCND